MVRHPFLFTLIEFARSHAFGPSPCVNSFRHVIPSRVFSFRQVESILASTTGQSGTRQFSPVRLPMSSRDVPTRLFQSVHTLSFDCSNLFGTRPFPPTDKPIRVISSSFDTTHPAIPSRILFDNPSLFNPHRRVRTIHVPPPLKRLAFSTTHYPPPHMTTRPHPARINSIRTTGQPSTAHLIRHVASHRIRPLRQDNPLPVDSHDISRPIMSN